MRSVRHCSVVTASGGLVTSVTADATDPGRGEARGRGRGADNQVIAGKIHNHTCTLYTETASNLCLMTHQSAVGDILHVTLQ